MIWLCEIRDASVMEAARIYAANGWPVFPCEGKEPANAHGFKEAQPSAAPFEAHHNIGWALLPGTFALDIDARKMGLQTWRKLEEKYGPLPLTVRQTTGRHDGSAHLIFRDGGRKLRQGADVLGPGIDTRCYGRGYLIIAPSIHPETSKPYQWHTVAEPAEAPAWLLDMLEVKAPTAAPYVPPVRVDARHLTQRQRYAAGVLRGLAADVAGAAEGGRNAALNRAWWRILQFRDVVPEGEARAELTRAALSCGLDEREIAKVLR